MPTYAYEAMNSSGQEVKDEVEAATSRRGHRQDPRQGVFPDQSPGKGGQKKAAKKKSAAGDPRTLQKKRKMPISIGGVPRKAVGQFHPPAFHAAGRRPADPAQPADSRTTAEAGPC